MSNRSHILFLIIFALLLNACQSTAPAAPVASTNAFTDVPPNTPAPEPTAEDQSDARPGEQTARLDFINNFDVAVCGVMVQTEITGEVWLVDTAGGMAAFEPDQTVGIDLPVGAMVVTRVVDCDGQLVEEMEFVLGAEGVQYYLSPTTGRGEG